MLSVLDLCMDLPIIASKWVDGLEIADIDFYQGHHPGNQGEIHHVKWVIVRQEQV